MACLKLLNDTDIEIDLYKKVKIMIFTEGTILGPPNIFKHFKHSLYTPIKNSVKTIKSWEEQGAEILYFTSRKKFREVQSIKEILIKHNFPGGYIYYRDKSEKYSNIVEFAAPDILIEDDCRSIGGKWQMCITYVKSEIKEKVNSIVVKEFNGIDDLPLSLSDLLKFHQI